MQKPIHTFIISENIMKREEAIAWFLDKIEKFQPGNSNVALYKNYFAGLTDEGLFELGEKLVSGEVVLPYYCANLVDKDVPMDRALAVGDELGIRFFQRIWIRDPVTGVTYLSPEKYLVIHMAIRRQQQHVLKGISVAENSTHIDTITGQATGPSKTTQISLPELSTLSAMGLTAAIEELTNVRGGNESGFKVSKQSILNTGSYSIADVKETNTRPTVIDTAKAFLLGMHIDSNL